MFFVCFLFKLTWIRNETSMFELNGWFLEDVLPPPQTIIDVRYCCAIDPTVLETINPERPIFAVNSSRELNVHREFHHRQTHCWINNPLCDLFKCSHLTLGNASFCRQSVLEYLRRRVKKVWPANRGDLGGHKSAEEAGERSVSRAQRSWCCPWCWTRGALGLIQLDGGSQSVTDHRGFAQTKNNDWAI